MQLSTEAFVCVVLLTISFIHCHKVPEIPDHIAQAIGAVGVGDFRQTLQRLDKEFHSNESREHFLSDIISEEDWAKTGLNTKRGVRNFIGNVLKDVKARAGYQVSAQCTNATLAIVQGLLDKRYSQWATRFLDAAGKPQSSLLRDLRLTWLGSFTECTETKTTSVPGLVDEAFNGKYCLANIPLKTTISPLITSVWEALCVPDVCNDSDTWILLHQGLETISTLLPQLGINVSTSFAWCQPREKPLDTKAIVAVVVVSVIVFLALVGTLYDIFIQCQPVHNIQDDGVRLGLLSNERKPEPLGTVGKLLLSFSVYTNGAKLLSTHQSEGALRCINGIRFISMSWVILGHTLALSPFQGINIVGNIGDFGIYLKRWTFYAILNATVSVDTFFLLSGLLVAYLVLKEMEKKKGRTNWLMYYVHRYIRLTPPYMLIIMVFSCLLTYSGSGPTFPPEDKNCPKYWWTNILYINNFVHSSQLEMCMGWSWYLANDMQFYIIAPLFLIPLFYFKIGGPVILGIATLASIITTAVISTDFNMGPNGGALRPGQPLPDQWTLIYIHPWTRLAPYTVGVYIGYVLYKTKCQMKMHWLLALAGWCMAAFFCCSTLYGVYGPYNGDQWSLELSAFYNSTFRYAWALGVGWVIFACCSGYGGFVNTLLSWKALIPLSRLTYCAYLVHPMVIIWYYNQQEVLIMLEIPNIIYYFFGHLIAAYSVAFVSSLLFESPVLGIEKVLLGRFR